MRRPRQNCVRPPPRRPRACRCWLLVGRARGAGKLAPRALVRPRRRAQASAARVFHRFGAWTGRGAGRVATVPGMMRSSCSFLGVVVVVCAAALTGCAPTGGGPLASPSTPTLVSREVVAPSASVTTSPTMVADEEFLARIPEDARYNDLLGAVEMAKFFITLHPGLYQGEDPAFFEFLGLPECEFCSSSVAVTRERLAQGIVQVGGDITVPPQVETSIMDFETDNTTTALVQFKMVEAPYEFRDATGAVTLSRGENWFRTSMALRHIDGAWRVYGVSVEDCGDEVCW